MTSSAGTLFGSDGHLNLKGPLVRRLGYALVILEFAVLAWLVANEGAAEVGWLAVGLVGAIGLAVAVASSWPLGAVFTLVIASAMPRLAGKVFGLHLRPEHIAIAAVLMALSVQIVRKRVGRLKVRNFDCFLVGYVVLNFLTSAITSPEPRMTLRWALMNAIVIAPFFLLRFMLTDMRKASQAVEMLLWVGAGESVIGLICFFSNAVFHTTFGVSAEQYGFIPGVYGTQYEANIFGSYCGCCTVLFLAFFLLHRGSNRSRYVWGMAICLLAALISLARSVLLALPIAGAFVLWAVYKSGRVQFRSLMRVALVVGVLGVVAGPFILDFIVKRFSTIDFDDLSADSSTLTRLVQTAAGLEDVRTHPLLGTGTDSFQLFFNWDDYMPGMGGDAEAGGWLGNTPLRVLHDTGILGLSVFLLFLGSLASKTRGAFRVADPQTRIVLVALSGGLILYAITFQATEATMLAFPWIHLGLLAAVVEIVRLRVPDNGE
jgi:O-antigen ligase